MAAPAIPRVSHATSRLQDARIDPASPAAAAFKDTVTRRIKGSAEAAGAVRLPCPLCPGNVADNAPQAPPRKFVIDLEEMEPPEDAPDQPGHITPYFLMTRGVGKDGAVSVQQDEAAVARAAEAVEELLGMEFARLARLAAAIK